MHTTEPLVRVQAVTKRFGEVTACDSVSLDLFAGEVHCLLGENGAGKSTLISLLAGQLQPDQGSMLIDGSVVQLATPATALEQGISVVYQHSQLVPQLTVLENLMLTGHGFWLSRQQATQQLAALNTGLDSTLHGDERVQQISLGQRQQFEIARAAEQSPRLLILDEPTSMLTEPGIHALMALVRKLADEGVAVVFVTHKLREAFAVADRVTVLRRGRVADRIEPGEPKDQQRVLAAMFGTHAELASHSQLAPQVSAPDAHPTIAPNTPAALELLGVSTAPEHAQHEHAQLEHAAPEHATLQNITLRVMPGEVLGIAGIDGHGQKQLAEVIAGVRRAHPGQILLGGHDISSASVRRRQQLGLSILTDDRLGEGVIARFSVALNLMLKRVGEQPFWRFGFTNHRAIRAEAVAQIAQYSIRMPSPDTPVGALSGGNIQKVLLAREFAGAPNVVVLHNPTVGLDLKTVEQVRETVREYVAGGGAVLLISTDLDELCELSHRIAVMSGGAIIGEVHNTAPADAPPSELTNEQLRSKVGELIARGTPHLAANATVHTTTTRGATQ